MNAHTYKHTYIHTYIHKDTHTHLNILIHKYNTQEQIYVYTSIPFCIYIYPKCKIRKILANFYIYAYFNRTSA